MNGGQPLVAVLDDEESVRQAIERLLRARGLHVECFASGRDFVASLQDRTPDCLVLDLHMADMSGFEVQSVLTKAGRSIPIVVITGHDSPESRQRALHGGAKAYFRKPVAGRELLSAVLAACGMPPPAEPAATG